MRQMRGSTLMKTYIKWVLFMVLPCYLIDQLTKWLILTHLQIGDFITILPGYFEIIHVRNTGAAFGLLQNIPGTFRTIFFFTITVIACMAILLIFWQTKDRSVLLKVVLCLILAGALGNLTDRLIHKEVVDFINLHIASYRWPTFNMADTYISLGMIGLLIYTFISPKPKPQQD
jgi:signal peptidase II